MSGSLINRGSRQTSRSGKVHPRGRAASRLLRLHRAPPPLLGRGSRRKRLVLVVDVGGGTSDFTLVHVGASPEGPLMRRIAVG